MKALVDRKANVIESYTYDAFGNLLERASGTAGTAQSANSLTHFQNDILYAGEQYDCVTETYYLRARNYSPSEGRFISEDRYHGDERNLYVYVGSNPLRYTDPSGYCKRSISEYAGEFWGKVLDELIEVAGDYIPPEYLFGLSVAYDYQSKHNEAVAELSEKASLFFMGATLPTLALTGKAMGFAAPSLATPAGPVVEGGTAVTGAIVVTGELVLALVSWAASGGNSSAAERNKDISEKLQDKANEKWAENSGAGKGGNSSWNKGSFDSPQESLEYHFKKHGEEVGAKDVDQYARKAEEFAKDVKKGSTKSYVRGEIEGVIRYKKNGKYIDIAPDGTIISFGKQ